MKNTIKYINFKIFVVDICDIMKFKNSERKDRWRFLRDEVINPFWYFFNYLEVCNCQGILYHSEEMVIGRGGLWNIGRMIQNFPAKSQ